MKGLEKGTLKTHLHIKGLILMDDILHLKAEDALMLHTSHFGPLDFSMSCIHLIVDTMSVVTFRTCFLKQVFLYRQNPLCYSILNKSLFNLFYFVIVFHEFAFF